MHNGIHLDYAHQIEIVKTINARKIGDELSQCAVNLKLVIIETTKYVNILL